MKLKMKASNQVFFGFVGIVALIYLGIIISFRVTLEEVQMDEKQVFREEKQDLEGSIRHIQLEKWQRLHIKQSETPYLAIFGNGESHKKVKHQIKGGKFTFKVEQDSSIKGRIDQITLGIPDLDSLTLLGNSHARLDTLLNLDTLYIQASHRTGGRLYTSAEYIKIHADDASNINLLGEVENLSIHCEGSAKLWAHDLQSQKVWVEISDGANAQVNAEQSLQGEASEGGILIQLGEATTDSLKVSDAAQISTR